MIETTEHCATMGKRRWWMGWRTGARHIAARGRSLGQGFVEYVLIILFVAIVVVAALTLLGPEIAAIFQTIANVL